MNTVYPLRLLCFVFTTACATTGASPNRPAATASAASVKDDAPQETPGAPDDPAPAPAPDDPARREAPDGPGAEEAPSKADPAPASEAVEPAPPEGGPKTSAKADDVKAPATCTYKTYQWSRTRKGPANKRTVSKPYSEVTDKERDPADPHGCSVCSEDQVALELEPLGFEGMGSIRVCRHYKAQVETALREIAESGEFVLVDIVGYRPGMTRGAWVNDLRTEFSNHSFGTAIDINAAFNGMYTGCRIKTLSTKALRSCRLGIGGAWQPQKNPRHTITKEGIVYRKITEHTGWKWGGDLTGSIRDIMHFSITGK